MKFLIIFFLSSIIPVSFAANILCIFPKPAYSHQLVYRGVTEKLLERGHRLTLLTTHPSDLEKSHENVTLVDVSFSVKIFKDLIDEMDQLKGSWKDSFHKMVDSETALIDKQLSSDEMQKLIGDRSQKFDLLLLETAGSSPMHAFAEHFNIPVVGISSSDAFSSGHEIMGNVMNPIAHPDRILPFTIAKTFLERFGSCLFNLLMKFVIIPRAEENYKPIMKKHFPNVNKSYYELVSNVDLQLVNAHPALGFNRPILSNTIQLGFLHIKPPKSLSSDLLNIVENSKSGVIYMSFGTVVTSKMAEENFESFMKAFAELPYDVLWKYDGEVSDSLPPNVHLDKWFPQSDLLAHANVKLFITHGGQHSVEESIISRVPMIVCPFQGDQNQNAERIVERGIAKSLNIHAKLNSDQIRDVIDDVIKAESFKKNIERLARLVEDNPMRSPDKAVWHIEYVIRHQGAKHFSYPQNQIPFYQYHYYDILLSVVGVILVIVLLIFGIMKCVFKLCNRIIVKKSKHD